MKQPWFKLRRAVRNWMLNREYTAVLTELLVAREHLNGLEGVYKTCYYHELVKDIISQRLRVAVLTDELNGIMEAQRQFNADIEPISIDN